MSAFLTIGLNDKGEKVNIDDAAHGKACNCFCPICHKPLIARNSKPLNEAKRVHHFAHSKGCNCEASDETVLHKLAKQIILEEKALMLPTFDSSNKPSGLIHFQSVEQETPIAVKTAIVINNALKRLINGQRYKRSKFFIFTNQLYQRHQ